MFLKLICLILNMVAMKKKLLLFALVLIQIHCLYGQGIDSLKFTKKFITVGETFHLDTRTNGVVKGYYVYNDRSFFKDDSGGLHSTFISNYELYYFFSDDGGKNWVGEKIITGEEGNIYKAVVCADINSKVYIAFTSNPYIKYANQQNGISTYYRFDCSLVSKVGDTWKTEPIYRNVGSYGFIVSDICIDKAGNVNILGSRYGWWTYGGEIWEVSKNIEGDISPLKILYKYEESYVDKSTGDAKYILHNDGTKDIVFGRSTNVNRVYRNSRLLSEISTIHFDGSDWNNPRQITTIWHGKSKSITFDKEGNNYLVTYDYSPQKILFYKNLGDPIQLDVDLSMISDHAWIKLIYLDDGNLYLIMYPHTYPEGTEIKNNYIYVSTDKGETWSDPIAIDRELYKIGTFANTNQYSETLPSADFIGYTRVSNKNPYGPDSLFFFKAEFINSRLGISDLYNKNNSLQISPNPVDDYLSINYDVDKQTNLDVIIYNVSGEVILKKSFIKKSNSDDIHIDTSILDKGFYFLQIVVKDGNYRLSRRFIKN